MGTVETWATNVVAWAKIPDLWKIRHTWESLSDAEFEGTANTPFTPEEQEAISGQLAAIREQIKKTYDLTAEQEAKIDARFEEAELRQRARAGQNRRESMIAVLPGRRPFRGYRCRWPNRC
jgi:hypothetical protein